MATTKTNPTPKPAGEPQAKPASVPPKQPDEAEKAEIAAEQALVLSPRPPVEVAGMTLTAPLERLPVELDVAVKTAMFRVRNLLALEPGQVIETRWVNGRDMPLTAGDVQLAWSEFEVIDTQLAVRVTRLV
jgi:flagellar motor switch/type III secretory pathway protein FliN